MERSRMGGAIPPLPQYSFMAWCTVKKAQGQFYLFIFSPAHIIHTVLNVRLSVNDEFERL
jgi:hypothetical protein